MTVALAVAVFLVSVPTFRHFFDLGVYRGAVRYWLLDGGKLYDFRFQQSVYGFTYPPFAALMFSPLVWTSWPIAIAIGLLINTAVIALLMWWYLVPLLRRTGRPVWTCCALAFCAIALFEPSRDTFSFGQVNLILLLLVITDMRASQRRSRWTGVGIGLAAAIKLTPAVFIGYLIVTRQYRAAAVAIGTTTTATLAAAVIAPRASREFWTDALWDTDRVGNLAYVSNQSLRGVVARLEAPVGWWVAAVLVALTVWWMRLRRTTDVQAGFALTGVLGCLISPVTWVHHLVWLMPALFLVTIAAIKSGRRRRLVAMIVVFVLLSSSVVWIWWANPYGWVAAIGSNTYVWISIGLLLTVPLGVRPPQRSPMRIAQRIPEIDRKLAAAELQPLRVIQLPAVRRRNANVGR